MISKHKVIIHKHNSVQNACPRIGKGGEAEVYRCQIKGHEDWGMFATKIRKTLNNPTEFQKLCKDAFKEFVIAKNLNHPHII